LSESHAPHPSVLSLDFHLRFLPCLLLRRFRKQGQSAFVPTGLLELMAALSVSGVLVATGFRVSGLPGWGIAGCGVLIAGYCALLSVRQCSVTPSYDAFLFGVLLFLMLVGLMLGLIFGLGSSRGVKGIFAVGGALAGYVAGLVGGLQLQRLGLLALVLDKLAALGAVGTTIPVALFLSDW
jgi:hypothetical protein